MALKRYHINPKTGRAGICVAKRTCRFGGEAIHYPSAYDAQAAYERSMERAARANQQLTPGAVAPLPSSFMDGTTGLIAPGTYVLVDPYAVIATLDQEGWNQVVGSVEEQFGWENGVSDPLQEKQPVVGALYEGEPLLMAKSFHGEGLHWSIGPTRRIPSDSGLVGVMSEKALARFGLTPEDVEAKKLGMRFELSEQKRFWRDRNGIIIVGKTALICHNELIQARWFESLDAADGHNNQQPTGKTYEFIQERAQNWIKDPISAAY